MLGSYPLGACPLGAPFPLDLSEVTPTPSAPGVWRVKFSLQPLLSVVLSAEPLVDACVSIDPLIDATITIGE
jgi:hypothetical protein